MSLRVFEKRFRCPVDGIKLFESLKDKPYAFFFESSLRRSGLGRYSFIGFDPFLTVRGDALGVFDELRGHFAEYRGHFRKAGPLFPAGIAGFFGYDFGIQLEGLRPRRDPGFLIPALAFGFYDRVIMIDHMTGELVIYSTGLPEKDHMLAGVRARRRLEEAEAVVREATQRRDAPFDASGREAFHTDCRQLSWRAGMSKAQYMESVGRALEHIGRGDVYQVNLAREFTISLPSSTEYTDAFMFYRQLRKVSPSCFAGYFHGGDFQLLSASPERFLRLRGRRIHTRPMKGTRRRDARRSEDERLRRELWESLKDKAELLMITDLERNDLGRICEYGSVRVKNLRTLERYATVFQTTSQIEGRLGAHKDCFDLIAACSPGGSITGCPKVRAMQIIQELEPAPRRFYTGSMGYISFTGSMDLNILIRSLAVQNRRATFHVGGGIVADSDPELEYEETLIKARALFLCLQEVYKNALPITDHGEKIFVD